MRWSIKILAFRLQGQAGEFTVGPALKKNKNKKETTTITLFCPSGR